MYIELLKEIYTNSSMTVHLYKESNKIDIRIGLRHRDTLSSMLFTAALENIFRRLTWETRCLRIDGKYLCHLRFADNIVICANITHDLQQMLQDLVAASEKSGSEECEDEQVEYKGDDGKRTPMYVNNTQTENVESYLYL